LGSTGWELKIFFDSGDVARTCNDDEMRIGRYGVALADAIRRRLGEIAAVPYLAQLRRVPAARLRYGTARHGTAQGSWYYLVSLGPAADLLMRPRDDPAPVLDDGRVDENVVRAVVIAAIVA
jgi:hypothetical protein